MSLRKVFMRPTIEDARRDDSNSINQIVLRLAEHLPAFGWEITANEAEADLFAAHAGQANGIQECDVAHCHGLYPTGIFPQDTSHWYINANVRDNILRAREVTVPSSWVADIVRRDFSIDPSIVPWAVDISEWALAKHDGTTLWNKTRVDEVCSLEPLKHLVTHIPAGRFVSTFYPEALDTVKVIGRLPFNQMKQHVQNSSLYLATTKETFGIGVLEAMASGTPILGFNWGAVPDFVTHGVHGFLAEPGDYAALEDGWHYCMTHREVLGQNARARALEYTWNRTAKEIAQVYDRAYRAKTNGAGSPQISVVIPSYNYGQYLETAVNSVMQQSTTVDFEVIVVDDNSTDNTPEVCRTLLKAYASWNNPRLRIIRNIQNLKVAETRNLGIRQARGEFIVCLDADDKLGSPKFLQTLYDYLREHPECGIAYTRLASFQDNNPDLLQLSAWPREANIGEHFIGHNQIPTCCMFRKIAWDRAGGYKRYATPAEDAELWSRIFLQGYSAQLVTNEAWFHYRWHDKSLSHTTRTGQVSAVDWLLHHPWHEYQRYPVAAPVKPPKHSWPVYNFDKPDIAIIVPVGPGHEVHLWQALDSIYAQSYTNWECIVVNDTGHALKLYPWVKVIEKTDYQRFGFASKARNAGVAAARSPLITFLDADDYFDRRFLERTIQKYVSTGRYVYTDWVSLKADRTREIGRTREYSTEAVFNEEALHTVNIVLPKKWFDAVGGFDERMSTWEDIDLFMKLASRGFCGTRLPEALITYDYASGSLREQGMIRMNELKELLVARYGQYMGPEAEMCKCNDPKVLLTPEEVLAAASSGEMVRIEYTGGAGNHYVIGASKQNYGRRKAGDFFWIWKSDLAADPRRFKPAPTTSPLRLDTEFPSEPQRLGALE